MEMRAMHEKKGGAGGKTHLWPFGLALCYLAARVGGARGGAVGSKGNSTAQLAHFASHTKSEGKYTTKSKTAPATIDISN